MQSHTTLSFTAAFANCEVLPKSAWWKWQKSSTIRHPQFTHRQAYLINQSSVPWPYHTCPRTLRWPRCDVGSVICIWGFLPKRFVKLAYRYQVDPVTLLTLRMLFACPGCFYVDGVDSRKGWHVAVSCVWPGRLPFPLAVATCQSRFWVPSPCSRHLAADAGPSPLSCFSLYFEVFW